MRRFWVFDPERSEEQGENLKSERRFAAGHSGEGVRRPPEGRAQPERFTKRYRPFMASKRRRLHSGHPPVDYLHVQRKDPAEDASLLVGSRCCHLGLPMVGHGGPYQLVCANSELHAAPPDDGCCARTPPADSRAGRSSFRMETHQIAPRGWSTSPVDVVRQLGVPVGRRLRQWRGACSEHRSTAPGADVRCTDNVWVRS